MPQELNIIIVPHTHWDREWYQTFQQFRIRLVHTIDKLLDILDRDPNFNHFMLDGQTIVLDDYLEVRPEQEEHLRHYIQNGRVLVGPWYLQPDEFLVSGESLIRNLQIGLQRAAEFGEPMRVGYVPDTFGHIGQMPQILSGFGIDNAVFWRGVGSEAKQSEFYWAAPDGTKVLVVHLADAIGYSNARVMPLTPEEFVTRVELLTAPLLQKATTNNLLLMNGSDHLEPQDGLPAVIEAANQILQDITPQEEKVLGRYARNGNMREYEHVHIHIGTLPQYIHAVRQQLDNSGEKSLETLSGEMRSSQYAHLLPSVLSTRMWIKQQNATTEHLLERWVEPLTAWAWKLGAPYPQGLVRLAWKYLLQNHPHDSICGCSIDQVHRENNLRFAQSQQIAESVIAQTISYLANAIDTRAPFSTSHTGQEPLPIVVFNPAPGPRSSAVQTVVQLPGSLRDAVIVDEQGKPMPYSVINRWKQELGSMSVAREMVAAAIALQEAGDVQASQTQGNFIRLAQEMISTALGQTGGAYVITRVHIEAESQHGLAHIEIMIAPRGRVSIEEQELYPAEQQIRELLKRDDIHTLEVSVIDQARETIDFVAADLPAYGLKTFWIYPRGLKKDEQVASTSSLSGKQNSIENEFYFVQVNKDDGTLTVTDKQTGAVYSGLNRFVDGGDVGDLYTYCPPANDTLVSKPIEPPKIELVSAGPVRAILCVSGRWLLPSSCATNRAERSSRMTFCPIVSEISLVPGVRRIDIHTSVENKVKDHRLRVIFPVPYTVESGAAEGAFEVRIRPVAAPQPEDISEWAEEPVNTFPQKRFVDISNGKIGLGVLNRGLPEYEIITPLEGNVGTRLIASAGPAGSELAGLAPARSETGQMAVALTLLRCVEWLSRGDLSTRRGHAGPMEQTPEAQCLGRQEFDYALVPHSGEWETDDALVLREAQDFNTSVRAAVTEQHEGQLPSRAALIEVEPPAVVVSAIKQSNTGNGVIVRVYNPLSHAVEASLRPGFACSKAFVANLQEESQEQLFWSGEEDDENGQAEPLHVGLRAGEILTVLFE